VGGMMRRPLICCSIYAIFILFCCSPKSNPGPESLNDGVRYLYAGEHDKAIKCFHEAIRYFSNVERNPQGLAAAYSNLGHAYIKKGDYDEAINYCSEAIQNDSTLTTAYNLMGAAYGLKGDHEREILCYREVIKIDPNDTDTYLNMGIAYFEMDEYDKAIGYLLKVIKIDPNHAKAYIGLIKSCSAKGNYAEADEYRRILLKLMSKGQ
jgi:tetratricopeptide (TPR) repeat protein